MGSIVHDPGKRSHYSSEELHAMLGHQEWNPITSGMAQTIAAWWHSPDSPNSTRLSTMGQVTSDMSIGDFEDPGAYPVDSREHRELEALEHYIRYYQTFPTTPAGYVFCACEECFEEIVGRQGDYCQECAKYCQ